MSDPLTDTNSSNIRINSCIRKHSALPLSLAPSRHPPLEVYENELTQSPAKTIALEVEGVGTVVITLTAEKNPLATTPPCSVDLPKTTGRHTHPHIPCKHLPSKPEATQKRVEAPLGFPSRRTHSPSIEEGEVGALERQTNMQLEELVQEAGNLV